ncbi:MAG: type II toxin-antitoxin system RelE/ParE family toxin [Elusimicrobiota bacterium]
MAYQVLLRSSAEKEMDALPGPFHKKIALKILALAETPRPPGCKKLSGTNGYRIRIGNYRVVYTVDDKAAVVTVVGVGHRREIYR